MKSLSLQAINETSTYPDLSAIVSEFTTTISLLSTKPE